MALTRIFFTTDIHGSDVCFKKFINAGKFYNANVIILGGDITGKMIVPIVKQSDGLYRSKFLGTEKTMKTEDELAAYMKTVSTSGYYPHTAEQAEVDELKNDKKKLDTLFLQLMIKRLQEWIQIAEERLEGTGIKCFINPGNDDAHIIDEHLKGTETIFNPEGKVVYVDQHHEMLSTGYANITPWHCPRDVSEEDLEERIETIASQVKDMKNCIFCLHCPPFDTPLDLGPELDQDLRPKLGMGGLKQVPVGSKAVRHALEKYQPLLGLHGHIHESRAAVKIGRTLCLNPGSEYGEGILKGALIELTEKGVKNYQFTSG